MALSPESDDDSGGGGGGGRHMSVKIPPPDSPAGGIADGAMTPRGTHSVARILTTIFTLTSLLIMVGAAAPLFRAQHMAGHIGSAMVCADMGQNRPIRVNTV